MRLSILIVLLALICLASARKGRNRVRAARERLRGDGRGDSDEVSLEMEGGRRKRVRLQRRNMDTRRPGRKNVDATILASDDLNTVCRQECETRRCRLRCLDREEKETCYYTDDKALCFEDSDDAVTEVHSPPANLRAPEEAMQRLAEENEKRKKRSIEPDYSQVGIVRLAFYCDRSYMQLWMGISNNNIAQAKAEVEDYLTLFVNEMSIQYSSLKEYGYTYTRRGETKTLDLAVTLDRVIYPTDDGTQFNDFSFVTDNTDGTRLFERTDVVNGQFVFSGALSDFRDFEAGDPFQDSYDAAMLLTNLDLTSVQNGQQSTGTIGIAWSSVVCYYSAMFYGYNTAITESDGRSIQIASHELGHGLGSPHDTTGECPRLTYLMSDTVIVPTSTNKDTYSRFSTCSARSINSFFQALDDVNQFHPLSLVSTTDTEFQSKFCSGPVGTAASTLDIQCKVFTERADSVACYASGQAVNTANQCVYTASQPSSLRYPIRCSTGANGACSSSSGLTQVSDGTPCTGDGQGDSFCYRGSCVARFAVCNLGATTTTQAPTTTTTTQAPTTTTTTQAPTTTTTTQAPTTTTTTQAPTTTTTTQAPTTTTTQAPTTTTTTQAPTTTTTQAPTTTTTTQAPTTTTTQAPTTTTTTQAPTTTTTTQAPTTTTTQAPTTTTTTQAPTTTTTPAPTTTTLAPRLTTTAEPRCSCTSRRCCRRNLNSDGSCCDGCRRNRRNRCNRPRQRN